MIQIIFLSNYSFSLVLLDILFFFLCNQLIFLLIAVIISFIVIPHSPIAQSLGLHRKPITLLVCVNCRSSVYTITTQPPM